MIIFVEDINKKDRAKIKRFFFIVFLNIKYFNKEENFLLFTKKYDEIMIKKNGCNAQVI